MTQLESGKSKITVSTSSEGPPAISQHEGKRSILTLDS